MKLRKLGSEGPEISVIGFGAWEAGGGSEWGTAPPDDRMPFGIYQGKRVSPC